MKLPFKQEKGESSLAWLMCQQYCGQIGNRSISIVLEANNYDIDKGIELAKKYKWEERASKYDNYIALIDHDGQVSCHAVMRQNTTNLTKLLNSHIRIYSNWMNNPQNRQVLSNELGLQEDCIKMVGSMARINNETTDAFIKQENIEIALKELAKEVQ